MDNSSSSAAKTPPTGSPAETGSASNLSKTAGFDQKTRTICIQGLQSLRAGFSQALLYPQGTPQYEKIAETTFEALNAVVEPLNGFHLSISRSEAIINGQRLDTPLSARAAVDQVDKFIYNAGLSSIKFEKGMALPELATFLQIVARKKFISSEGAAINKQLRELGITHILVGELRYVGLSEGEKVVSKAGRGESNHSGIQDAVKGMADTFQDTMDRIGDAEARKQLQVEMTGQLIEHDKAMLASVLMVSSEYLRSSNSDDVAALAAMPRRDTELLNTVLRIARMLQQKGIQNDDEIFASLRTFVAKLAEPYRARAEDILSQLELDDATTFLLPDWLVRATASVKGGSAEDRLDGILAQSACALLDERMFPQILDVLDEFSVARLDEHAERLTTHVAGAVKAPTKQMRMKAVERLSVLLERSMEQTSPAVKIIEDALLDACLHETCDEVMGLLLAHLARRCEHHYTLENYERALEYFEWIASLEHASRSALRDEGANLARKTREGMVAGNFAKTLAGDILAADPKGKTSLRMLQLLGRGAWGGVLELLCATDDESVAAALAGHLTAFGKEGQQLFFTAFERVKDNKDKPLALRLLELAPNVSMDAGLWRPAFNLMRHPDPAVYARAVDCALKLGADESVRAIFDLLRNEKDLPNRSGLLAAVAHSADPKALKMLIQDLNNAVSAPQFDEAQVVPILEALGGFDSDELVGPVSALISPKGRTLILTGEAGRHSKTVTMAAIKALAKVHKNPTAAEALERARAHKDPEVSRLALAALRGLVAAKQQQEEPAARSSGAARDSALMPATAGKSGGQTAIRSRRGFEELQSAEEVDTLFKAGAALGRKPGGTNANIGGAGEKDGAPAAPPEQRAVLQGQLKDMGLEMTIRMAGGKDGTLIIGAPGPAAAPGGGDARIVIRNKTIIYAAYQDKLGLEALAKIDGIKDAPFAYFTQLPAPNANMDIDIKDVRIAVQEFFKGTNTNENQFY